MVMEINSNFIADIIVLALREKLNSEIKLSG